MAAIGETVREKGYPDVLLFQVGSFHHTEIIMLSRLAIVSKSRSGSHALACLSLACNWQCLWLHACL